MVLVSDHPGENHGALGVVTLEDVIEELIGEEIVDETDVFVDVSRHLKRMTPAVAFSHHSFHRISSRHLHRGSADSNSSPTPNTPSMSRGGSFYTTGSLQQAKQTIPSGVAVAASRQTPGMKPLNLAQEPLSTMSTKVTIKPGAEVRNAQQAATILSQEERLAGKRAARENYGTMQSGATVADEGAAGAANGSRTTRASLIEERITVSNDSRRPSKVVISPVLEAHDLERDGHERSPLL